MKPSLQREQRLYDALKRITKYMNPDELRRISERKYGLDGDEAIEMAYENVLNEARSAIKGLRRPEQLAGPCPDGCAGVPVQCGNPGEMHGDCWRVKQPPIDGVGGTDAR